MIEKLLPVTYKSLRRKGLEKFKGISIEDAEQKLEEMGYTPNTWDTLLTSGDRKLGSHDVRTLILIAKGVNIFE
jgi:hypothetical protein